MIELSDKIVAMWFLSLDDESDYMACLERKDEENQYKLTFRFRYYVVEGAPHSGWDTKNWYEAHLRGTKEQALKLAKKPIELLESISGNKADMIMASSAEEYFEAMSKKGYVHMETLTEEEFKERMKNGR